MLDVSRRLLLVCLLLSGQALAADQLTDEHKQARALLDKMTAATRTLSYDGVFVYSRNDDMDAMRIIHQANKGNERERLIALTGPAREVVRNGQSVTCIFPDDQSVVIEKSRPYKLPSAQFPQSVADLADSYTFRLAGEDRTAGREARIVEILPRDRFRYGYRLWLDKQHHLLLKSELLGEQGKAIEQFMFTRLNVVDDVPDRLLEPSISGSDYSWYENPDDDHAPADDDAWQVGWLPKGFSISNRSNELLADSARPVQHLVYSDGLALISVFVEPVSQDSGIMIGPSKLGAVHAFARQAEGHQVMVVGEVPSITVRQMAESVAYKP